MTNTEPDFELILSAPVFRTLATLVNSLAIREWEFSRRGPWITSQSIDPSRCVFMTMEFAPFKPEETTEEVTPDPGTDSDPAITDKIREYNLRLSTEEVFGISKRGRLADQTIRITAHTEEKGDETTQAARISVIGPKRTTYYDIRPVKPSLDEKEQIENLVNTLSSITYDAKVAPTPEFLEALRDCEIFSDAVDIHIDPDGIKLVAEGNAGKATSLIKPRTDTAPILIRLDQPVGPISYPLSYMKDILGPLTPLDPNFRLSTMRRSPARFDFANDEVRITIFLAPHLDDEEDSEDDEPEGDDDPEKPHAEQETETRTTTEPAPDHPEPIPVDRNTTTDPIPAR